MKVGVVVGRFQVDELHEGHRILLDTANEQNSAVIVILGSGPLPTSGRNPLPFETRAAIIRREYPQAIIAELSDHHSDLEWSNALDELVDNIVAFTPELNYTTEVSFYGSRDSFIDYYNGHYDYVHVESADIGSSGTLRRERIAKHPLGSTDFARGVIWANHQRFPTVYGVVDMGIYSVLSEDDDPHIMLITKHDREGYYFPGGFCDVGSASDEDDASRETLEETGIKVDPEQWRYVKSLTVLDDWRYRGEIDEMRTRIFSTVLSDRPEPTAGDDAATAQWVAISSLKREDFHANHHRLYDILIGAMNEPDPSN
jgi:ADP-ribose pyrophosphatase YjhB (NUDIX family)